MGKYKDRIYCGWMIMHCLWHWPAIIDLFGFCVLYFPLLPWCVVNEASFLFCACSYGVLYSKTHCL